MFEKRYRLLWQLAKGLHKAQAKTLVAMTIGLIDCGQMRSFALADALAQASSVRFKSALQRFYRWVRGSKLDELACWSALADHLLAASGRRPLVAVDWTEWHSGLRVLSAALCVNTRAVPVLVQAFSKTDIPRSQNTRENTFVQMRARLSVHMSRVVMIFDRGFRRVSLIRELKALGQPFIVRLAAKVHVVGADYAGLLSQHPLGPGQRVELGLCTLGQRNPVRVRIVAVWARGQHEPWWLASTLSCTPKRLAEYYDRRMGVEEGFRDSKGCRYGLKIKWTRFQSGSAIARLFLLAALAMLVWYAAALLACRVDPTLRLTSKSKGPRRSLLAVGLNSPRAVASVLRWPITRLRKHWEPPTLREFAW